MKILLVDTTLGGRLIGGAQTFLAKLVQGLVEAEIDVHLLADGEGEGRIRDAIKRSGAKIHTDLRSSGVLVDDVTPDVAAWINDLQPDAYVVSVSPDIGWSVLPYLDPKIATLTIGHNDEKTFYDPVKHYASFLTRAIGVSEAICRNYVQDCGVAADRVKWIPYGVETLDSFHVEAISREVDRPIDDEPIRLVYVGRFENSQKRIADIASIARGVAAEKVPFTFDLVGDGEEMTFVRERLADLISRGWVRLHGWLQSDEVIQNLRENEVFVLASAYEGFCISLIESMANGCCPIVTDIESGNKQLVEDDINGFVVPVGDVAAFVDRIKSLAANRNRLNEMRERAWKTGQAYRIGRMVESYKQCFEEAIKDTRANPRTLDPNFPLMQSCRSKFPIWMRRLKARAKALVK